MYLYRVASSPVRIAKATRVLYTQTKKDPGKLPHPPLYPTHRFTFLLESGLSDTYMRWILSRCNTVSSPRLSPLACPRVTHPHILALRWCQLQQIRHHHYPHTPATPSWYVLRCPTSIIFSWDLSLRLHLIWEKSASYSTPPPNPSYPCLSSVQSRQVQCAKTPFFLPLALSKVSSPSTSITVSCCSLSGASENGSRLVQISTPPTLTGLRYTIQHTHTQMCLPILIFPLPD